MKQNSYFWVNGLLFLSHLLCDPCVLVQIFPEPSEQLEPGQVKERLPSIMVEPSEESEEESGGLQWPPLHTQTSVDEEEEEDPFQDNREPNSTGQGGQINADGSVPADSAIHIHKNELQESFTHKLIFCHHTIFCGNHLFLIYRVNLQKGQQTQ